MQIGARSRCPSPPQQWWTCASGKTQVEQQSRVEKVVEDKADQNDVGKVDLQKGKIASLRLLQDKVLPDYCYLLLDKAQA